MIKKILKDRRTYSVREKEKVWYQNGNKMCVCVCATLVGGGRSCVGPP